MAGKVTEVKASLALFLGKLEQEEVTWPSALDSFSALSGQVSTLTKQLRVDRTSSMQNYLFLPLQLSNDHDPQLEKVTDGRLTFMHHEIVPDYLRTKLELGLEKSLSDRQEDVQQIGAEGCKRVIVQHNSLVRSLAESIKAAREAIDEQISKFETHSSAPSPETKRLLRAYVYGEGLKTVSAPRKAQLLSKRGGLRAAAAPSTHPYLPKPGAALR